jgi:hypothetical protein
MRWNFPLESRFSYWCLKTIWIHSAAAFVSILLHSISQTANLSIAAHLGISAVSLTLTTTTPCNDANPNVCALSLPVILANYTYTYDSDLPTSWQYHTPCCISSVRREIGALPHLFKEYNTHTSHTRSVGCWKGTASMWLRVAVARLLMSQAPGQMVFILLRLFPFIPLVLYSSSCVFLTTKALVFSLFIYHVRAGDGECNCSGKHDISLSNPCPISHVCMCLCVFLFALLYLPEKQTVFSSLEPAGWIWMEVGGDVMLD